jgi:SPX domain protein involved in polyphosphate accumulation
MVQIEKIVLFTIEKQGLLAGRLQRLWERRKVAQEMYGDDEDMESALCVEHFDMTIPHLMEDYRQVGVELLQLLQFVELNATGLRKILKKFDKRVGFRLRAQYIASRSNHPYSQLQLVFRQVGIGAMVATISQNLVELRAQRFEMSSTSSSVSLFRHASLPRRVVEEEPIIKVLFVFATFILSLRMLFTCVKTRYEILLHHVINLVNCMNAELHPTWRYIKCK